MAPPFADVRRLPCVLETTTAPEHLDAASGHLTVTGHLALHVSASAQRLQQWLPPSDAAAPDRTVMDLEHHLRYLAEVHADTRLAIHERLVDRRAKTVHGLRFLVDLDREVVASSFEFVSVHVDLASRRAVPFGSATASALDGALELAAGLDWAPPLCGALRLSR